MSLFSSFSEVEQGRFATVYENGRAEGRGGGNCNVYDVLLRGGGGVNREGLCSLSSLRLLKLTSTQKN